MICFRDGQASAAVAFEGHAPQGPRLQAQNTCHESAVHDLMTQVHQLMERAYQQYRDARLCQWTAQLVAPVGSDVQLSVFDQWLLEKLMTTCPQFQVGWTPLQDVPAAFRVLRVGSSLRIQVMLGGLSGVPHTTVIAVSDVHQLTTAVRDFVGQVIATSVSAGAAD
ncbi:hypothetical protein GCM10008957_42350 [Deinococcus ruber]|uniref:Uncharacterized protein n=2 Tax=Deinococcus ruber TaxID=1848197 RepID=A0A918FAZ2_9DEIO|nr:hypothetical protein GCM10008957_42350 [Deinococcus ruber]